MITRATLKELKNKWGLLMIDKDYDFNYNIYLMGELLLCKGLD